LVPDGVRVSGGDLPPLEVAALAGRTGPVRTEPPAGGGHLLIAPGNWAGQGRAWAAAVERYLPGWTASNLAVLPPAGQVFEADVTVDAEQWLRPVTRADIALELVCPATHVLLEDLRPFGGWSQARPGPADPAVARADLETILASGRQVAVMLHGTAGRHPGEHAALYPWSPYRLPGGLGLAADLDESGEVVAAAVADQDDPGGASARAHRTWVEAQRDRVDKVRQVLAGLDVPVFTATLDMLDFLPEAVWLPITIGPADFAPAPPWHPKGKLRVAHAPSNARLKGSDLVDRALERLAAAGLVEYIRVEGVPPLAMPALIRGVDVVVDQVVLGNPATLLNQTMAAGRLAVGNIAGPVRRRFPVAPPVLQADPADLADVIADVAREPEAYRSLAAAGPAFARAVCDGRLAADVLWRAWLNRPTSNRKAEA
jgi:hypothetical protein